MGGRGPKSNHMPNQLNIIDIELRQRVDAVIRASKKKRDGMVVAGGGIAIKAKKCACCGNYSLPANSEYETCPVCGWIDDNYQNAHPDSPNGKNPISLKKAREILEKVLATKA